MTILGTLFGFFTFKNEKLIKEISDHKRTKRVLLESEKKNHKLVSHIYDITEALRKSEDKFRSVFRTSPDSICLNRLEDGVYVDINEGFTKFLGYSREDVVGNSSVELNIWDDFKYRDYLLSKLKKHGVFENREVKFKKKDGQIRIGLMSARLLSVENKNIILSITHDVTERKLADKELQDSEKRYRQLVENIAEQVWEINTENVFTYISPNAIDGYGLIPEKIIGKKPFDLMPGPEGKRVAQIFKKFKKARKPFWNLENIVQHPDGRLAYLEVTGFPYFDNKGKLLGYRGTTINITDRKQNERDTQTLVESTVGKIGKELFDTVVVRICEWLGCECAIIGEIIPGNKIQTISMVLDGEPVMNYSYNLKGSPCEEAIRNGYCVYPENAGILFPDNPDLIEMGSGGYVGIRLENQKGDAAGILCGISRDRLHITKHTKNMMKIIGARVSGEIERKKAEEGKIKLESQLQQAQKMDAIGTLAGGIAHDFNNILFPILTYAEMMEDQISEEHPFYENINEILTGAKRARALVKQILTFSRQADYETVPLRPHLIVKEVIKLMRATIPSSIEIKQTICSDCKTIMADPTKLHQIVINLVTNAYHAMQDTGGKLSISLKNIDIDDKNKEFANLGTGSYVLLSIEDTGTGIDDAAIDQIFEPYFTTKSKDRGTGLGLPVAHGIVKNYGGEITVRSTLGKGTLFNVYLPACENRNDFFDTVDTEAHPGGNERILLVDDEKSVLSSEKQILTRLGYDVEIRQNSIDALKSFRASPESFDLVITDMTMPNLTGDILARKLIAIRPDISIIICTGFSERINKEKTEADGIDGFLIKPVTMSEMARAVRNALDKADCLIQG